MSLIGDAAPEDAYDADDKVAERLDVLHHIVADLERLHSELPRTLDEDGRFRVKDALRLLDEIKRHRAEVGSLRTRLEAL
jgi:hypothetical protein